MLEYILVLRQRVIKFSSIAIINPRMVISSAEIYRYIGMVITGTFIGGTL